MMSLRAEIMTSLFGAWCLFKFDPSGMRYFNHTADGFWRSFSAALIALPMFLVLSILHTTYAEAGRSTGIGLHLLRYVLGWVVFPIVMVCLVQVLERRGQFASYIIAINWLAIPQWTLVLVVSYLGTALGGIVGDLFVLSLLMLLLYYDYFVTRLVLDLGFGKTILVVVIGLLLAVLLDALILSLGRGA